MRKAILYSGVILAMSGVFFSGFGITCPITPEPKSFKVKSEDKWIMAGDCRIVLGKNAGAVERYAAKQLQIKIKKTFNITVDIIGENNVPSKGQIIAAGCGKSNLFLNGLCRKYRSKADALPGSDGFVIETVKYNNQEIIIIAGANERGVSYGMDAFFETLLAENGKVCFNQVSIRDWASIAWRGRPCDSISLHDVESLDACVASRINWIDLRDSNEPGKSATFGYAAGVEFDKAAARRVLDNAHERGIFVYGTVSCGVSKEKFPAVIKTFKDLIAVGVDGLWISFDDPGPGQGADMLVEQVIKLGKDNGICPSHIAITPPSGSYQDIDTNWNKMVAKAVGASEIKWFFTRVPCREDVALMKKIGIKTLPAYWHNWPRPSGGLLHDMGGGRPLYPRKWAYYQLLPLSAGWLSPTDDELRDAPKYTDSVMLWQTRPADYDCAIMGLWGWDPQKYDWERSRMWTYVRIYGPSQADEAKSFDDKLAKLESLFVVPKYKETGPKFWPAKLKNLNSKDAAVAILDEMDGLLRVLEANSPAQTSIDADRLTSSYLVPMRDIITYGRKLATAEFPEYTLKDLDQKMLKLMEQGNTQEVQSIVNANRDNVNAKIAAIMSSLSELKFIRDYGDHWNQMMTMDHWKQRLAQSQLRAEQLKNERKEMESRFVEIVKGDFDKLLAKQAKVPSGKIVMEISADKWYRGAHRIKAMPAIGLYKNTAVLAFGSGKNAEGGLAELLGEFKIPQYSKRLWLAVFVAHEVTGATLPDVRISSMRLDRKVIWNQDVTVPLKDWVLLDITDQALVGDQVALRFTLRNKTDSENFKSIVFVGPALLIEK